MPKNQNNKVVPAKVDGMPPEVAIELLTTPKVKMTNRLRKTCFAAREKVYPSIAPIKKVPKGYKMIDKGLVLDFELEYGEPRLEIEVKLGRKVHQLKFCQLVKHSVRVPRRIANLRSRYLKLMNSNKPEVIKNFEGAQLTQTVAFLEKVQAALEAEIKLRYKVVAH